MVAKPSGHKLRVRSAATGSKKTPKTPSESREHVWRRVDECACSVKTMFVAMNWGFCPYNVKYVHMGKEQTSRGCGSLVRRWVLITLSISWLPRWPNVPKRKSKNSPCSVKSMSGKDSSSPPPAHPFFFCISCHLKSGESARAGPRPPWKILLMRRRHRRPPPPISRGSDWCPRCCRCRDNPAWPFVSM